MTKHAGGRPRQGTTKKVSITLTDAEWAMLDEYQTVAAFIKEKLNNKETSTPEPTRSSAPEPVAPSPNECTKKEVNERFDITIGLMEKGHPYTDQMIENTRDVILRNLLPQNSEAVSIETKIQYVCPFTGKRFGSISKLIESAIPNLLEGELSKVKQKEQKRQREASPKYWMN